MVYVDNSQITPLYANTASGTIADASVVDPAIAALVTAINTNADIYTAFITALELPIPDQSIVTRHLRNLAVTSSKLAALAVTADKIADGSITLAKLQDLVVTAAKIANGTITEPKYADGSVSKRAIAPNAIDASKMDPSLYANITDVAINTRFGRIEAQLIDVVLDVKMLGATGSGVADETAILQSIFDYSTNSLRQIYFPDGDYKINPVTKLRVRSNTRLIFSQNARLVTDTPTSDIYSMLDVVDVQNVEIINPKIVGSRTTSVPVSEGAGHGISCRNVTNLRITGAVVSNCYTDGIYINNVTNALIEFSSFDNNRRQGLSLISGENILIKNSYFTNTNGTAPQCGVDVEPNSANEKLKNIKFENIVTSGNTAYGIAINYNNLDNANTVIDLTFKNCVDDGSLSGFAVTKYLGNVNESSTIIFEDCKSLNAKGASVQVVGHKAAGTAKITFIRTEMFNPNVSLGSNQRQYDVAFSIHSETTGYPAGLEQGNVEIIDPSISVLSGRSVLRGMYLGYSNPLKNVIVHNPKRMDIGDTSNISANNNHNLISFGATAFSNVKIIDAFGVLSISSAAASIRNFSSSVYTEIIGSLAGTINVFDFANFLVIDSISLVKTSASGSMVVTLPTTVTCVDAAGTVITGTLTSSTTGAILNFRKIRSGVFKVTKEFGTWT